MRQLFSVIAALFMLVGSLGMLPQEASAKPVPIEQVQPSIVGPVINVSPSNVWNCSLYMDIYAASSSVQGYTNAYCPGSGYKSLYTCLWQYNVVLACQSVGTYGNYLTSKPTDWSCWYGSASYFRVSVSLYYGQSRYTNYYEVFNKDCH